jgi:hypothetical protein
MRKLLITAVMFSLVALTGCDDQNARDYAKELVGVLKSYQGEVNKKIAAEKKSYKDLAGAYAYAKQVELQTRLRTERLSRADSLTDDLIGGRKLSPSDLHKLLLDHANLEFESTRQALSQESDGQAEYLASLETLELQAQNIAQLTKALEALAKPKGDIKKLKELAASAKAFKSKFDELECGELAEQIACLKAQQAAIDAALDLTPEQKKKKKEKLDDQIKQLLELSKEQKCDQDQLKNAKCPDKKG